MHNMFEVSLIFDHGSGESGACQEQGGGTLTWNCSEQDELLLIIIQVTSMLIWKFFNRLSVVNSRKNWTQ